MKKFVFPAMVTVVLALGTAASGQEVRYRAEISASDRVNSRGAQLKTLREFLRQDRYNFHGKHHVDPGDTEDPRFGTVAARTLIDGARLVVPPGLEAGVMEGRITRLEVTVSGTDKSLLMRVAPVTEGGVTSTGAMPAPGGPTREGPGTVPVAEAPMAPGPPNGFRHVYSATLGPADWMDSNGVPWSRLSDVLKQDRANVNRLGRQDRGDERDPFLNSARDRSVFDSAPLFLDSALAGPLGRRESVRVTVHVDMEGKLFVTRPGADSRAEVLPAEELLAEREWKVRALVLSGNPDAGNALRERVELSDLVKGRESAESALARLELADFFFGADRADEAKVLVGEIERDFRAAAGRGVDSEAIVTVMGFLVRARIALGETDAAEKLLDELLEPPGRDRWRLTDPERAELEKLRQQTSASKVAELGPGEEMTYEEALADLAKLEKDPASTAIDRLALLTGVIQLHPKRKGQDYELLHRRLAERIPAIDRAALDDRGASILGDGLLTLAFADFRASAFPSARARCEEAIDLLKSPERQEQFPSIMARRLLVRTLTAEGKVGEAEALAREHYNWGLSLFNPLDGRMLDLAYQYFDFLADRGDAAAVEAAGGEIADQVLKQDFPVVRSRIDWYVLIAAMAFKAGDFERTDTRYRRLIDEVGKEAALHPLLGEVYSQWGNLYEGEGHYGKAEAIWSEGVALLESKEDLVSAYVSLLQDLSLVRKHYQDHQGAIELIEKGRDLAAERLGRDSQEYAVACNNLVLPLYSIGRIEEALRMADEALRVAAEHPDREWGKDAEFNFRNNRAIPLMNTDPAAAAKIYEEIVEGMERRGNFEEFRLSSFLANLGAARRESGDLDGAEQAYLRALDILRNQGWEDERNLAIILDALASLALRKGRLAEAVDRVREASALADRFLQTASAVASDSEKLALASFRNYGNHVHILLAAGEEEEACEIALRSKGAVLDQSIREAIALHRIATDPEKKEIFETIRSKQRQIERITLALQHGGAEPEENEALARLRQETKQLQAELLLGDDAGFRSPSVVDLAVLRGRLGEGDRFIEFVEATPPDGDPYFGAFEISRDSLRWVKLSSVEMTRIAVTSFRESVDAFLTANSEAKLDDARDGLEKASRRLAELVWDPLSAGAGEGRLVLSPDNLLHFVPFAVLLDKDGRFPGEGRSIEYVGSARDFCREDAGRRRDLASAVVVGGPDYRFPLAGDATGAEGETPIGPLVRREDEEILARGGIARSEMSLAPLPGAEKEAGLIAETLSATGTKVTLLTAAEATERAVAGAAGPAIVHVATHGVFFDYDFGSLVSEGSGKEIDPMLRGALALTGAQSSIGSWSRARYPEGDNDGWLFAAEAARLDLRGTELVTLSACETGIGGLASGEGVVGLRRAFLAAGARHVLSTLWPIADEMTVELMRGFYERIGRGEPVSEAFASAQGEALETLREQDARGDAIALFGAFVMNRAGN